MERRETRSIPAISLRQQPISHQNTLVDQLKLIFPNEIPVLNSRKESQLKYSAEKHSNLELDVWFPNLNICFEFQDDYHYVTTWYNHKSIKQVHQTDDHKKEIIARTALRLILISCWWRGDLESLISTIHDSCPDAVQPSSAPPIPLNPPTCFFPPRKILDVGELTHPSFMIDPALLSEHNWWLGEKYDGIRCCWNTEKRVLYSRHGNQITLHSKLCAHIPSSANAIDGELWFGRNNFELTYQLVNAAVEYTRWELLRLIGFETAAIEMQQSTFEIRYAEALGNMTSNNPFVIVPARLALPYVEQLNYFAEFIIEDGGEGIILQQFQAGYECGRSRSIMKFKMTLEDREGMVIGKDHHAVHLKLPNGMLFSVPFEDVHLSNLSIGDIVTFSCSNYTHRHTPVNPVIHKWRTDVSWKDIIRLYLQEQRYLGGSPFFSKSTGFSISEMRQFMESFARKRFMNPLLAETWYIIKDSELYVYKRGRKIMRLFKGYASAVQQLFPDISFDAKVLRESTLRDSGSKRKVFENFANENNFDPLVPKNWYLQSKDKMLASPDVYRVIEGSYGNNASKTLMDLFPEIGLEKLEFSFHWGNPKKRRRFFEKYAKENGFDPMNPDDWYSQSKKKLLAVNGTRQIIRYHNDSITKSLLDLFPHIGLDRAKLLQSPWRDQRKQREFFEDYARQNQFNPLDPENWYSQAEQMQQQKIARKIMSHYNGSLHETLAALYPELRFKKSRFRKVAFQNAANRREFFVKFALGTGLDPLVPENWYNVDQQKIMATKGAYTIMDYHGNSTSKALVDLFPEMSLDISKFWRSPLNDPAKRRAFFEQYAAGKHFDPLVPGNWHSQPTSQLMQIKGVHNVIKFHGGSIKETLINLFPEVGLAEDLSWK